MAVLKEREPSRKLPKVRKLPSEPTTFGKRLPGHCRRLAPSNRGYRRRMSRRRSLRHRCRGRRTGWPRRVPRTAGSGRCWRRSCCRGRGPELWRCRSFSPSLRPLGAWIERDQGHRRRDLVRGAAGFMPAATLRRNVRPVDIFGPGGGAHRQPRSSDRLTTLRGLYRRGRPERELHADTELQFIEVNALIGRVDVIVSTVIGDEPRRGLRDLRLAAEREPEEPPGSDESM